MLENQAMSLELQKIKKRYKQFRELLEQVESRDKAEIVSENLKLKKVQTEISSELETLREENEKLKTRLGEKDRDLLKLKVCYHRTKFLKHMISRNFFYKLSSRIVARIPKADVSNEIYHQFYQSTGVK